MKFCESSKRIKNKLFMILAGVLLVSVVSCKKNQPVVNVGDVIEIQITDSNKVDLVEHPYSWSVTPQRICVLFGYAFNKSEDYEPLLDLLKKKYGLDEDGGLIYPLIYGESFKRGVRGYVSELSAALEDQDKELVGVVILGAPENTHRALANHQDFWDMEVPFPIISLFPQDDILGMESTCDIVIDKAQNAEISGALLEEEEIDYMKDTPDLLCDTIDYIQLAGTSFKKDGTLHVHVKQMLKNRSFHRYADPETGLQAINHFVLN